MLQETQKALIVGSLLIIAIITIISATGMKKTEPFDATGWVYNVPPNWFRVQEYDPRQFLVRTYPDHIESSCMPYSRASKFGSLENINYLSNASRFWRM